MDAVFVAGCFYAVVYSVDEAGFNDLDVVVGFGGFGVELGDGVEEDGGRGVGA